MMTEFPASSVSKCRRTCRVRRDLLWVMATGVAAAFACVAVAAEPRAPRDAIVADFTKPLAEPWRWIREHRGAWRVSPAGLQVLVEPGNMWGGDNDARNVLGLMPHPERAISDLLGSADGVPLLRSLLASASAAAAA